ncbi:PAAR domain-containing protein [Saezia sanguinis]|uniref:PAAR domain-containing protein n=1 Tax=Saezia sanguinis TaxID=1965230 RepID=UPI00304049D5
MAQTIIRGAGVIPGMREIVRIGHKHLCPLQGACPLGHGMTEVVTGSPTCHIKGIPIARIGDRISCGAEIVTGSRRARIDDNRPVARLGDLTYHPVCQVQGELIEGEPDWKLE